MALLEQVMIRGVRSVGMSDNEAYTVRFLNPLTIINGPNGTGKTTLIEALNYITTGALPSGGLHNFIHSVKVARRPRVDGSVKLQFRDPLKRTVVATKRFVAHESKSKVTCKSEEFTIQITLADGTVKSLSSKVADFQKEMVNILGVPTAIMDFVIFCHQEESCWPLSEPKKLKERFDAIFQLTKFVKAHEHLLRLKKDYKTERSVVLEREQGLRRNITQKAKYVKVRENCETESTDAEREIERLKVSIKEANEELKHLQQQLQECNACMQTTNITQARIDDNEKTLRAMRVSDYPGSILDLRREIETAKSSAEFRDIEFEREQLRSRMDDVQLESERLKRELQKTNERLVKLRTNAQMREKYVAEQNSMKARLMNTFELDLDLLSIEEFITEREEVLASVLNEGQSQMASLSERVSNAQQQLTRVQIEMESNKTTQEKTRGEISVLKRSLQSASSSNAELASLAVEIGRIETRMQSLPQADEAKMTNLRQERRSQQEQVDSLRSELESVKEFEDDEKNMTRVSNELNECKWKIGKLMDKHRSDIVALFGEVTNEKLAPKLSYEATKATNSLKKLRDEVGFAEMRSDRELQLMKKLEEHLATVEREQEVVEEKIFQAAKCSKSEVEIRLKEVKKLLAKARKELAPLNSKATLYETWSTETTAKTCCPLCERRFTSKSAASELASKLHDMSISMPDEIDRLEKEVMKREEEERGLASAVIYVDQLKELDEKRETALEKMEKSKVDLDVKRKDVEECKKHLLAAEQTNERIRRIQPDASLIDSLVSMKEDLSSQEENLRRRLDGRGSKRSGTRVKAELAEAEELCTRTATELDDLQEAASERNKLTEKLHATRERRIKLGELAAQATNLQEQVNEKEDLLVELVAQFDNARRRLPGARSLYENDLSARRTCETELRKKETSEQSRIAELRALSRQYEGISNQIGSLHVSEKSMQEFQQQYDRTQRDIEASEQRRTAMLCELNQLDSKKSHLATLESQMTKMSIRETLDKLRAELKACEWKGPDRRTMERRFNELTTTKTQSESDRSRIIGQRDEIQKKYTEAIRELSSKEMTNAEKLYRDVVADRVVLDAVIDDLDSYSKCLDDSLIQFHSEKMKLINEILDDLWRKVYKGNDIDSIKIVSDVADKNVNKNRSYDYKVVMIMDGNREIDMRDRCSAGQKMLASLLIRVALSDVFGGLCSIIALDEPTTNLDIIKVENIAEMLNNLIAARRNDDPDGTITGRQFQMIVITHDERLVNKLTTACRPEFIYVLEKNQIGNTMIKRQFPDGHKEAAT